MRFVSTGLDGGGYGRAQTGALEADYTYDSAGRTVSVSYPMSFRDGNNNHPVLTYGYDSTGRPVSLTDSSGDLTPAPTSWASNVQYDYAGRLTGMQYLASVSPYLSNYQETRSYNANGQLSSINWPYPWQTGIQYVYSATQNNGQITQMLDTISGETISYQYDALKRLASASSTPSNGSAPTAWTQSYQYDGFGNLTAKVLNGTTSAIPVTAATNRLTNASYDANGNMTSGVGATLGYDVANRLVTASEVSGGQERYGYSADNKRIYRAKANGQEEWTFYGVSGEKLGTYTLDDPAGSCGWGYVCPAEYPFLPQTTNVWFAGKLIYTATPYYTDGSGPTRLDRLGTNRASGARFYPYGDEITSTANDREKFATYTRDSYTGLDYADQRFYASSYGRFNTPDPYMASAKGVSDPTAPSSWNRYSYVLGNPINFNDPNGTCAQDTAYSVNVCDSVGPVNGGFFGTFYAAPLRVMREDPLPMTIQDASKFAAQLKNIMRVSPGYTNCNAVADFAQGLADSGVTAKQMMADFGAITPRQAASVAGGVSTSASAVTLYNGGDNGFGSAYQNTVNDGPGGNGDQGHHLAAFLQMGFKLGAVGGAAAAYAFELGEAALSGSVVNQGDIALGVAAAQIGAELSAGGVLQPGDLSAAINGLCKH